MLFVQRTIRFPLLPTVDQQDVLLETMQQYTECFNTVAAYGWERCESRLSRGKSKRKENFRRKLPRFSLVGNPLQPSNQFDVLEATSIPSAMTSVPTPFTGITFRWQPLLAGR